MKDRNENRPGYKKTKVGWIPDEWETASLGDIATVFVSNVDKKNNPNEVDVLLCNYTDVYYNDYIKPDINFMKATASENEIKKYRLQSGDVIITKDSETNLDIAVSAIVKDEFPNLICGYHLAIIRPKRNNIYGEYLNKLFGLSIIRNSFSKLASGVTRFGLSLSAIKNAIILLPNLSEQKRIAEILSTWDKAIEQTRKLIDAKKRRKKALMQQLLTGIKRLPGFFKPWEEFLLGDLATINFSNVDKKVNHNEISVRLCNYTDVYYNDQITKDLNLMKATATNTEIAKYKLVKNDVIITKDSEIAEDIAVPCYVADDAEDIVCGYHLAIIRPHPAKIYGPFLSYLLTTDQVHYQFVRIANGVTRFGLTNGSVKKIKITIPPLEEQQRIFEVISIADEQIDILENKLSALEKQKRGLMQKLLTGEVRVKL
ncbi:MAG: restriction endonuclease subunit S [Thermodesulfobacteriota bacterium]|nr:restriction endonuclease subunit S [Thermodesulfobacteriota bacterium]